MSRKILLAITLAALLCATGQPLGLKVGAAAGNEDNTDYTRTPPFLTAAAPPLVMIVMGRDHKLYYEAYNDASDLDGDGDLDVGYNPDEIDYYGYFDSYKCYEYDGTNQYFKPTSLSVASQYPTAGSNGKACGGASEWSGDFLNYLTMSRMDAIRKVLYGGYRAVDGTEDADTVLQRAYIPQEGHSWGKQYTSKAVDGYDIAEYTPLSLPDSGKRHLFCSVNNTENRDPKLRLLTNSTYYIWEWVSIENPVSGNRVVNGKTGPTVSPTDYLVRVKVCDPSVGLESNCKIYPGTDGKFGSGHDPCKPVGLLQRYGETEQMFFGLITGSYEKNMSGGVLRKKINLITDEINANTGQYLTKDNNDFDPSDDEYQANGIIKTIDKLRIKNFDYDEYEYYPYYPDGWIDRVMQEGEFTDWGNPTAEMMYEALRYFSGAGSATSAFDYSSGDDVSLGLPKATWDDPYAADDSWCSMPVMLVISDINPNYDSDQLPGSVFSTWPAESLGASGGTLNAQTLLDTISTAENISGTYFIGDNTSNSDYSCAPKSVTTLKNVRGLCPEEPGKEGSYYAAAVAYYGHEEDMSSKTSEQKVLTYTVGLSSPLPRIEIKLGNPEKTITLVPFGKSIWDDSSYYNISNLQGDYQPTNSIVDFYVESLTSTSGQFRINFEDMEQAADQDMDAYVRYSYQVLDADGNPVSNPADGVKVGITLQSVYASGNIVQHMGYIISGTTKDGTYLEVRDSDTQNYMATSWKKDGDKDYFLDTPPGVDPGGTWEDSTPLPLIAYREFSPSGASAAQILNDPLWYAAKWGGFRDHDLNNIPNLPAEWDEDLDGTPDNYFLVQNPLMLERQLNRAFVSILERASSGTYASLLSASRSGEGAVYQSIFFPRYKSVYWVGNVHALLVDAYGQLREDTNLNKTLDNDADKIIEFDPVNPGEVRKYTDTNGDGELTATEKGSQSPQLEDVATVKYLWSGADWLNSLDDSKILQNKVYSSSDKNRYIFTFIDGDNDMLVDSGELWLFSSSPTANLDAIKPFLHLAEPFTQSLTGSEVTSKATDQLDFIRGVDQTGMRNRKFDSDDDDSVDTTYRLGDIVSSTPTLVGAPAEHYDLLYRDDSYRKFWLKYSNRRSVVYVGANDGMLHAFNAGFFYVDTDQESPTYGKWKFHTQSEGGSETAYDLGAELWAYVPFNLLPHLYWLTDPNYEHVSYVDMKPKIFDAKIFADDGPTGTHPGGWGTVMVCGMGFGGGRIRTDKDHDADPETGSTDQIMKSAYFILDITNPESTPVLLAEVAFDDLGFTTSYPGAIVVKSMDSETNPNNWYLVLGSGPNGARLKYSRLNKSGTLQAGDLLVGQTSGGRARYVSVDTSDKIVTVSEVVGWFENGENIYHDEDGSGGFNSNKDPYLVMDTLNSTSDLKNGLSSQKAKIYVIDLNALAASTPSLKTLAPNGTWNTGASNAVSFVNTGDADYDLDDNSFISDFITVDLDLNYSTDAMYFGTVSDGSLGLGGKLARIVLSDPDTNILPTDPTSWDQYSTLFDAGQPMSSAPSVAMDWKRRTWVFFGTGHFSSQADIADTSQQSYYGIKEPWLDTSGHENNRVDMNTDVDGDGANDLENEMTWQEVSSAYLLDVSNVVVFESGNIKNYNGVSYTDVVDLENNVLDTFYALEQEMDEDPYPANNNPAPSTDIFPNGWKLDFSGARERNLGQATLLGDVLTYTTYAPDPDVCENEGDSYLYATHYMTGTAFTSSVIGFGSATDPADGTSMELSRKQSLGKGLASSPTLHTGSETGSKAYVQTSGGSILVIEQENPGAVKSGKKYWMEE